MARESMEAIIRRLRLLINDADSAIWSDEELQDFLDERRDEARYMQIEGLQSRAAGTGAITFKTFTAQFGWWEDSVELTDTRYNPLTPTVSDLVTGRWTFADEPSGRIVLLNGFTYDIYGAASDACRSRASAVAGLVDTKEGDTEYKYSQQPKQWLEMADDFARKARLKTACLVRDDLSTAR